MTDEQIVLPEETPEGQRIMAEFQKDKEELTARLDVAKNRAWQAVLASSRNIAQAALNKIQEEIGVREQRLQADLQALVQPAPTASAAPAPAVADSPAAEGPASSAAAEPEAAPGSAAPASDAGPSSPANGPASSPAGGVSEVVNDAPQASPVVAASPTTGAIDYQATIEQLKQALAAAEAAKLASEQPDPDSLSG